MKIAVLGCGTMGQMLARKMIHANYPSNEIYVANRTAAKASDLCRQNPALRLASGFTEAVQDASIVFLCVQPMACLDVIATIRPFIRKGAHIVSIVADISIETLEAALGEKVSRMMPTITTEVDMGVTLFSPNKAVGQDDMAVLKTLFGNSLDFEIIEEKQMNILSALTSCGPGLISALLDKFVETVNHDAGIDKSLASEMLLKTVQGTVEIALRQKLTLHEVYSKVATVGGITERGSTVLNTALPAVYGEMLAVMERRHNERHDQIQQLFKQRLAGEI